MGTHYRYVNYTRKEYLSLSDLRDGGDKVSALIYCSAALAWLLMPGWMRGDGYCGRWAPVLETRSRQDVDHKLTVANDIRVVPDYDDWHHLEEFVNISPGVLQSMRDNQPLDDALARGRAGSGIGASIATAIAGWGPRAHTITMQLRVRRDHRYELLDAVRASCTCGWTIGPLRDLDREHILELAVSEHTVHDE